MKTRIRQLTEQEKRSLGEQQMITDWLQLFPKGILSIVSDTFDLWKLITEYLPANKDAILSRDGKLVIRPDSGDPVDIICGLNTSTQDRIDHPLTVNGKITASGNIRFVESGASLAEWKGVIELLWDIFGGTVNEQGYKVLDSHIGAIYGDSITLDRQIQIYERLKAKGFACTNIILGVGSFTYQYNTRDTLGFAAKGAWFEVVNGDGTKTAYNIYKDPVTDNGTKKSLKGLCTVLKDTNGDYFVKTECTPEEESTGYLQTIYMNGTFYNETSLAEIRNTIKYGI